MRPEGFKIVGFDVESIKNKFYSLQLYTEDGCLTLPDTYEHPTRIFTTDKENISLMFSHSTRGALYVGTFSEIDLYWISDWLTHNGFNVKMVWLGSRLLWAKITKDEGTHVWRIIDTLNLFPKQGVEALGKLIGVLKLPKPSYIGEREPKPEEMSAFREYALRDAEISYKITAHVRDEIGFLRPTLPSMALRYWSSMSPILSYNNQNKPYRLSDAIRYNGQNTYPDLVTAQFASYHGGRVEAFGRGTWFDEVYVYDFRSMYPSVMLNEYPDVSKMPFVLRNVRLDDLDGYDGVVKASFTQDCAIPPIGLPRALGGDNYPRLLFANGSYTEYVTLAELRYLEEMGYGSVGEIHVAQLWDSGLDLFTDYIRDVWDKRARYRGKNEVLSDFYKLLMNSLYGKFGERAKSISLEVQKDGTLKIVIDDIEMEDRMAIANDKGMNRLSPIVASYTTAYARLKLHEELMRYGGEDVLYCDTDSLHTLKPRPCAEGLGNLELKYGKKVNRATYVRAKFYLLDDAIVCKGLPARATVKGKVIDADTIRLKLAENAEDFSVTMDYLVRWRAALVRRLEPYTRLVEPKRFTFDADKKRIYLKDLNGKALIMNNTLSKPRLI